MNKASYANAGSGVDASEIGWINYEGLGQLEVGKPILGIENELKDGYVISFDLKLEESSNQGIPFEFRKPPLYAEVAFGNTAYLGINEPVVLYPRSYPYIPGIQWTVTMSNIVVRDSAGKSIKNYAIVMANPEENNRGESWGGITNGQPWIKLETMPAVGGKIFPFYVQGRGSNTVTTYGFKDDGTKIGNVPALVFWTANPTEVQSILYTVLGKEGVTFGVRILVEEFLNRNNCVLQV